MSYTTVDYDDYEPYVGNRPKGLITLHGPGGGHGTTWTVDALVDTGADFMQLPHSAASGVGISFSKAVPVRLAGVGGIVQMQQVPVDVEIQGVKVRIPVNFGRNAQPLIGRQAMFAVLRNAGFSTTEWLLEWWPHHQHIHSTSSAQTSSSKVENLSTSPSDDHYTLQIVDHGSWIDVGGIPLVKRNL